MSREIVSLRSIPAIHVELGAAYAPLGEAMEAVDPNDPASALMAKEEADGAEDWEARTEAWKAWLCFCFSEGPWPPAVARALVAMTRALAPDLCRGMPAAQWRALDAARPMPAALRAITGAPYEAAHLALARCWRRERAVVAAPVAVSFSAMWASEGARSAAERADREAVLVAWLRRVWRGGPDLREALKVVFVHVRAVAPEAAWNMTGEEVAALFGQGRAAESARVKRDYSRELERAGFRATAARFQKSETACRKFAVAQRGNRNRARVK